MNKITAVVTTTEPPMLRTFQVAHVDRPITTVVGNVPQVLPDGTLQILRYKGEVPWTIALFAPGQWAALAVDVPSDKELGALEAYNVMRAARDRAANTDTGKTTH
jgi:hypothetical protein